MMTTADLFTHALSLPAAQRAELAQRLIDSLPQANEPPLGASDEEIAARLDAVASGEFEANDWRESISHMRAALANCQTQAE